MLCLFILLFVIQIIFHQKVIKDIVDNSVFQYANHNDYFGFWKFDNLALEKFWKFLVIFLRSLYEFGFLGVLRRR